MEVNQGIQHPRLVALLVWIPFQVIGTLFIIIRYLEIIYSGMHYVLEWVMQMVKFSGWTSKPLLVLLFSLTIINCNQAQESMKYNKLTIEELKLSLNDSLLLKAKYMFSNDVFIVTAKSATSC